MRFHFRARLAASLFVLALALTACTSSPRGDVEGTSLLGTPLTRSPLAPERLPELERQLAEAKAALDRDPQSEDAAIWHGRRLAYLGRYRDAIDVFTRALAIHPDSHRLLRHRGHRYITLRQFDRAIADLQRAAAFCERVPDAIEPDGAPNARGTPRSTDRSNIYYHLGLALYLAGRFEESDAAFARRTALAAYNDDMIVSTTHWRYLALRRIGREADAAALLEPIRPGMYIAENDGYYRLCRYYKGLIAEDEALARKPDGGIDAGAAYGVAMMRHIRGDRAGARALFDEILAKTNWASFGHIAAEAEMARDPRR